MNTNEIIRASYLQKLAKELDGAADSISELPTSHAPAEELQQAVEDLRRSAYDLVSTCNLFLDG